MRPRAPAVTHPRRDVGVLRHPAASSRAASRFRLADSRFAWSCSFAAGPSGLVEVPYRFADREQGESKMSWKEAARYFVQLKNLYVLRWSRTAPGASAAPRVHGSGNRTAVTGRCAARTSNLELQTQNLTNNGQVPKFDVRSSGCWGFQQPVSGFDLPRFVVDVRRPLELGRRGDNLPGHFDGAPRFGSGRRAA